MQTAMNFNPMYHFVTYFRDIVIWNTMPGLTENLLCLGMGLVMFAIGYLVFSKTQRKFILYV
jgi:ABC-2 type transport system permease protein